MPLKATVYAGIAARYTASPDLGAAEYNVPKDDDTVFEAGVGDFQSDALWTDTRTLATNTTEDIDLRGALADIFGVGAVFVEVTALLIKSAAANTTNLTIGNGTNPAQLFFGATTHSIILQPGGTMLLTAPKTGWAITAGTADILKVANAAGASATYNIKIMGRLS